MMDRDALIEGHRHLVNATLKRTVPKVPPRVDRDDLVAAGNLGLVKAANAFDPSRGVRFSSLAITWIKGSILEYLRTEDWVPRSIREKQKRGEPVVIAEMLSMEFLQRQRVLGNSGGDRDDENWVSYLEVIPDPAPGPEETALATLEREELWRQVERLPEPERETVTLYYREEWKLREIGERASRCDSRIKQRAQSALAKLRRRMG